MPQITNVTLHSFSSEDPNFPARNLIETKVTKKWKCEKAGEKSVFVILKLDKPYKLTQIDIGNEFTGVIEILVGNSQLVPPKFQEIILATSLMTIFDAKNERNPNGVRMFGRDLFNPAVVDTQWDLVKIICSQPFNSHRQYGLSFINLHTNEEVTQNDDIESPIKSKIPMIQKPSSSSEKKTPRVATKIGKFRFRDSNSSDEEETSPFAQWKHKKDNPQSTNSKVTPKSSIKEQLKEKLESESKRRRVDDDDDKIAKVKQDRNRSKGLFYESSDDEPNEKLQKKIEKDKELKSSTQKQHQLPMKPTPTKSTPSTSKFSSFLNDDDDERNKRPSVSSPQSKNKLKVEEKKKVNKEIRYKPFNKLMEGVTFVISGYQNPERGVIRQKALDMGAKYKADWDDSCTHLICAYSNTPKYNQVRGKGKIISKKWIENCFIEQKMIPWRRYALDNSEKNKPESEDEIHCEWHRPKSSIESELKETKVEQSDDSDGDMLIVDRRGQKNDIKIIIDSDSESDMAIVDKTNKNNIKDDKMDSKQDNDDDCTTNRFEDEQPQQQQSQNDERNNNKNEIETVVYSEDDSVSSIDITTVECQAFRDKIFYLNEDLSATDKIKLGDNIKHMLGIVTKNPHKAHYIISKQGKKLPSNFKAEVVKEIWIRECFDLQAFIPTTRYRI